MDKQIEKMVKLIQNNPDLPVIAVIGKGVTASDDYHGQAGRIVDSSVREYLMGRHGIHFKFYSDDWGHINSLLIDALDNGGEDMTDAEALDYYRNKVPWTRAVVVEICTLKENRRKG